MMPGDVHAPSHVGVVLVVVPDATLRQIVVRIMRGGGFQPVPVSTIAHARLLALGSSARVAALVADLPARELEATNLISALLSWYPRAPTLLMTCLKPAPGDRFAPDGVPSVQWIEKPFRRADFLGALTRMASTADLGEPSR